jgi:putative hemin transport protein
MAAAQKLGPVMALTRNESCVHEVTGIYQGYYSGAHACMVLCAVVDLRLFPSNWHYGFAVEKDTGQGVQRSLQIFDTAGDAIHKIYLTLGSSHAVSAEVVAALAQADQSQTLTPEPRKPTEAAKSVLDKCEAQRKEWGRMTDTHQFLRLTSKLKMNRLGAYRIAGDPFVRPLPVETVDQMLNLVKADGLCSGPINFVDAFKPV